MHTTKFSGLCNASESSSIEIVEVLDAIVDVDGKDFLAPKRTVFLIPTFSTMASIIISTSSKPL